MSAPSRFGSWLPESPRERTVERAADRQPGRTANPSGILARSTAVSSSPIVTLPWRSRDERTSSMDTATFALDLTGTYAPGPAVLAGVVGAVYVAMV